MPICEADPWRMQYFEGVDCPDDVFVATEDADAYRWYPDHHWVYDKLRVAETQGLRAAPHGVDPEAFPVFSKPIYNMKGMGAGSRKIRSAREYKRLERAGHFWTDLLDGDHVSTDLAVVAGEVVWCRHVSGVPLKGGMFDYWIVEAGLRNDVVEYCSKWILTHLSGYTGMMNVETIGGRIIEAHLRFADQWPDLYGPGWVEAVVELYRAGRWVFKEPPAQVGYSVVLFGAHGVQYVHPSSEFQDQVRGETETLTSLQITFHEDRPPEQHSMPPGGFRLAILNGYDLDALRKGRERLALSFWSTQHSLPKRSRAS